MNRYLISGAEKTSGQDKRIELLALTEADAREAAIKEGILITECKLIADKSAPATRSEAYLREIVLWLRFFGIITALAIFAVILRIVMKY
jgi:hypothetical protein